MWKQLLRFRNNKFSNKSREPVIECELPPGPAVGVTDLSPKPNLEPMFYSLNGLDRKLREKISKRNGYFVELGANDGVDQSNTLHFERELGWRGVLIEPIPHRYLECIRNRSPENKIFCNACVSKEYQKEFVRIIYSNLMSVAPELCLDLPRTPAEHAELGIQFLPIGERSFEFGAVARTLTNVLVEAGAPKIIDLLSLDVEGAERDVLMGLDFDRFSFEHMVIESRDLNKIDSLLKSKGYELVGPLSEQDYHYRLLG